MQRIQQTDGNEDQQHRRRSHSRPAVTDALPGRPPQRIAQDSQPKTPAATKSSQISTSDQRMTGRKAIS
jgi:hypothetical protein